MEDSVKSKKNGKKSRIPVSDGNKCNDEEPKYKKSKKKQKINSNLNDEDQELPTTDLMSMKKSKKLEDSSQEVELVTVSDGSNCNDEKPKYKKSKKKHKINSNLNDEDQEPPTTDLMSMKKSKKLEDSSQEVELVTVSDGSKCNDEKPKYKKSKKNQKMNSNLNAEDQEPPTTDLMSMKKSKKLEDSSQEAELVTVIDGSKCNDEKPKYKKSKKKQRINSNLNDEDQEPPTDLMSMKKSKKLEDSSQEVETETGNTKPEKINKHKVKKSINVDSEVVAKSNNSIGSKDDEMDVDSSSNDESDISDGDSANSESSFKMDSYPSDDDDDDPSEDEEANKKRGLPVGAVPSAELEERENRTIFVGNLPKTVERHELQKWFSKFGRVECVRLRSAPIADLEMPKKVAVIKKSFHENRSNIHAYIRYKDIEGAHNALQANCTKYGEFTLRVDNARHKGGYDGKKAVFVGNVPFNIEENSLISFFSKCGEIDGVRIIRDKQTGVGKGFAYVNFKCSSSVPLALKLDGEDLEKRQLRVKPVKYNGKSSHKIPSNFSQKRNNFKFKSVSGQVNPKGFDKMKKHDPSKKPPFKKSKFQGEFSKRKERTKFKKKSFTTKKREIYSKILANKKKTD